MASILKFQRLKKKVKDLATTKRQSDLVMRTARIADALQTTTELRFSVVTNKKNKLRLSTTAETRSKRLRKILRTLIISERSTSWDTSIIILWY